MEQTYRRTPTVADELPLPGTGQVLGSVVLESWRGVYAHIYDLGAPRTIAAFVIDWVRPEAGRVRVLNL